MAGFSGLGFSEDYPPEPQGPSPGTPAQPEQAAAPSPSFGGYPQDNGSGKSMLSDTSDAVADLHTMLATSRPGVPEPLDPGFNAPTQAAPHDLGPSGTELATQRYAALVPRGFSHPRSGLGRGLSVAMRMTGAAPPSGFTGPRVPSMNGVSSGQVQKSWGQGTPGPQVSQSSANGISQGDLQRRAGTG